MMNTEEAVNDVKATTERYLNRISTLLPAYEDVMRMVASLPFVEGVDVTAGWHVCGSPEIHIDVRVDSLDQATPVIHGLEALGFDVPMPHDNPALMLRSFDATRGDGNYMTTERVRVFVFVSSDGPCKGIPTGETVPVLKFVCPGDADYPVEANDADA